MNIDGYMATSETVFFKPTNNFWGYFLKPEWKWRRFHDCGAGVGALTKAMREHGLETIAYDRHQRDRPRVPDIKIGDIVNILDMDLGEVALLARPCHHPELIEGAINRALEVSEAFYIGKREPASFATDLEIYDYEVVAKDVGQDDELLIRIHCEKERRKIRRLISSPSMPNKREWWWYKPSRDRYGSYPDCFSGFDATGNETVYKEEFWATDLQTVYKKADVCKDDSDYGWIAPDGEWFGCEYAGHDTVAREVLGCSVGRLEKLGFIRCHGDGTWTTSWLEDEKRQPNARQARTMRKKGYKPTKSKI